MPQSEIWQGHILVERYAAKGSGDRLGQRVTISDPPNIYRDFEAKFAQVCS